MACSQFLAPNGEPSLLYASLEQEFGKDRAVQLWNWSKTLSAEEKDVNGEMTVTALKAQLSAVDYKPKLISALFSADTSVLYNKFFKNNPDKFYQELTAKAGKQQVQWLKDYVARTNPQSYQNLVTGIAAEMSYTVEITTAKHTYAYNASDPDYDSEGNIINQGTNSQYYSNMTVPGGTNYTENEIATPAITPSIKGHAQFATDKGIGWFRSDEAIIPGSEGKLQSDGAGGLVRTSISAKTTRRILEVQSDLFQKGRSENILSEKYVYSVREAEDGRGYDLWANDGSIKEVIENYQTMDWAMREKEKLDNLQKASTENQFLQLLNKDNAWVTFFVKSIIQDSQKKGYEKVLFPVGSTIAKIEGYQDLEQFISYRKERIEEGTKLLQQISTNTNFRYNDEFYNFDVRAIDSSDPDFDPQYNFEERVTNIKTHTEHKVAQFTRELQEAEAGTLKTQTVEKFYENTVFNVLKKQGFNPTRITDEYRNEWYEVTVPQNIIAINLTKEGTQEVELDPFIRSFTAAMNELEQKATASPSQTFKLPFTPETRLKINDKWYSGLSLANVLEQRKLPANIVYDERFDRLFAKLPVNFIETISAPQFPLGIEQAPVERQMNQFFAQIKNVDRIPTGKWFSYEVQKDALDTIIFSFSNVFSELNTNASLQKEFAESGKSMLQFVKMKVFQRLDNNRQIWNQIALGTSESATAEQKARVAKVSEERKNSAPAKVLLYNDVINSFEGRNGLWKFALDRMASLGLKVSESALEIDERAIVRDEESGEIRFEEGSMLQDFSDSSFELDQKDTASARIKLFLATIPQSKLGDEVRPKDLSLLISNDETRRAIQTKTRRSIVIKGKLADTQKWIPENELKNPERAVAAHQRIIQVDGTDIRAKAVRRIVPADLSPEFIAEVESAMGFTPAEGDVLATVEHYVPVSNVLTSEMTMLESPKLVDFDVLFQDLSSLLANREPNWEVYREAMKESGNANIQQALLKLDKAPLHVQKEFVSVFSAHYQRMLMVLMTRSKNGMLESHIIDSNRNSEQRTILRFWEEAQKTSGILTKNAVGAYTVDANIAQELMAKLQAIYALPVPSRSITVQQADKQYGAKAGEFLRQEDKKVEASRAAQEVMRATFLRKVLSINGIEMSDEALTDLQRNIAQYGKGSGITALFGGFTEGGEPKGLIDRLVWSMNNDESEVAEEEAQYKVNNPLYTRSTEMGILTRVQLKYTPQVFSQTHKSTEGKTIYSYGLNSALSHDIRRFKDDRAFRDRYMASIMGKNNWLYHELTNSDKNRDRFQLTYLDGLNNRYGNQDGVVRSGMSDREQWLTALSMYINNGHEKMHMFSLTHSDKTKTPLFMNVPRAIDVITLKGQWTSKAIDTIYTSVFKPEYERAVQPAAGTYEGYETARKHFYFLPLFNYANMKAEVKSGSITQQQMDIFWNRDTKELNGIETKGWTEFVKGFIYRQLNTIARETEDSVTASGLLEDGLVVGNEVHMRRTLETAGYGTKNSRNPNIVTLEDEDAKVVYTKLMLREYAFNAFLFNTSLAQLFYGDPALTWKKNVESTMVEYGKRLAKDIAPGRDGEFSHSPTYTAVTAQDWQPVVKELSMISGYDKVEATDAQELVTVQEHIDVLLAYGKITEQQHTAISSIIDKANGGYYKLPTELENIVFQPMKPVAAGLKDPDQYGTMYYDYVKSSAFPLYPPATAGLQLDKLRRAMEKGGVQRFNYSSTRKMGRPATQVEVFRKDGTIDEDVFKSNAWLSGSRQSMDRSQFRIQQEVPYDEDKDAILTVSQMNKLITERIGSMTTKFTFKGEQVSGAIIRNEKERIRIELIDRKFKKFLERVGAEYNEEEGRLEFRDKKKFYNLLAQEAGSRDGYTVNDILALTSYTKNGKLTVPLMFSPSANRFEGLIMSMIKKIVDVKMPGKSYVQGSPAGFQTWEDTKDKSGIVWVDPSFTGPLKTARPGEDGQTLPAQVLLPFNFFDSNGNRLSAKDYTTDGVIDLTKIPRELLQFIGARIPNQGHSSMLPIEVVGFLPEQMGDLVIVPAAITKQMGADFDVDKLYMYHRSYSDMNGTLVPSIDPEEEGYLLNEYFDIHWSVLTNSEMLSSMMSPLDKPDLSDEAALLNQQRTSSLYYFSPAYQLSDFQSMKGAKALVGVTSLALTHNAVVQNKNIRLMQYVNMEGVDMPVLTDTSIQAAGITLTHISGYGETEYNGEKRTKADNIQVQQSESVDHAKNRVIDKINLDPTTVGASMAMSRLQSADEGIPGTEDFTPGTALPLTFNTRMLMQPVVREYSALMSRGNDSLSVNFQLKLDEAVSEQLRTKYTNLAVANIPEDVNPEEYMQRTLKESGFMNENGEINSTPEILLQTLNMEVGPEFYMRQFYLFNLFQEFNTIGKQLTTLQTLTAQDTRGAGKDMLSALNVAEKRVNPSWFVNDPKFILAGENMEGVFISDEGIPNETGKVFEATINTATQLLQDDLPYQNLLPLYQQIQEHSGKSTGLSDTQKKKVFSAVKSFVFSSNQLMLFEDAEKERMRLMYGENSLAKRLYRAQRTWGRSNYLLQRLSPVVNPDGLRPDVIEYSAAKASRSDDFENSKAWLDLLLNEDQEKRELGEDMLRYLFATGGVQSARNFVKFIPWAVLEGTDIAEQLRAWKDALQGINNMPQFLEQYFQHNPGQARQLSEDFRETGKEYAFPPIEFALPALSSEGNPAKSLSIIVTNEMGKRTEQYPLYISYRDKTSNRWILYRQTGRYTTDSGSIYQQIDLLGDRTTTLLEYNGSAAENVRSVFAENRAEEYPEVTNSSLTSIVPYRNARALEAIGIMDTTGNKEDITASLEIIAIDAQQPSHVRVMASALAKMQRNIAEESAARVAAIPNLPLRFTLNVNTATAGQFNSGLTELELNPKHFNFKQQAGEIVVHEMLHYHTALLAMAYQSDWSKYTEGTKRAMTKIKAFIDANPELEKRLKALEETRKLGFDKFKAQIIANKGIEYWNKLENSKDESVDQHDRIVYYGLNTLVEFIPHIFTSQPVIGFLNNQRYDGPKSILEHLKEMITQLWGAFIEALGVAKDSLLEESVKRGLDVVMYNQTVSYDWMKSMTADYSIFSDLSNQILATSTSTNLDSVSRLVGKLEEQKWRLISSQPQIKDPVTKAKRKREIDTIEEQIKQLKDKKELLLVPKIAETHLKWMQSVINKPSATVNELNSALSLANLWKNVNDIMFRDTSIDDPEYVRIAQQATNAERALTKRVREAVKTQFDLTDMDFSDDRLQDVNSIENTIRSLQSAAKNSVVSKVAQYVSTVGRQEDEEVQMELKALNKLEKRIAELAKKKGLNKQQIYLKLSSAGDGEWGRTLQYSGKWFSTREAMIGKRNGRLAGIDKMQEIEPVKRTMRAKVWEEFYKEMNAFSIGIDTNQFFDPQTGAFKEDVAAARAKLVAAVGEDHVQTVLNRAQERYLKYVEDRNNLFALIDEEVGAGEKTQEEAEIEKNEFQNRHSPNVFFSKSSQRSLATASEKYTTFAPLASATDMWNETYREIAEDEDLKEIYREYYSTIDRLVSYLPLTVQQQVGSAFLPVVTNSQVTDTFDFAAYFRSFNERAVKSVAASQFEQDLNERLYNKIPIEFVDENAVEPKDRSKDLIAIGRLFAMMATHYKHASAAKDVIEMGQSILNEVHKSRVEGNSQTEQSGRVVTVKKGLANALESIEYMVDYMIYRKPRKLEMNLSGKLYAERVDDKRKFSLNPLEQKRITNDISRLLLEKKELDRQFQYPESPEEQLSTDEYMERMKKLDEQLSRYEGFTLYGSKIGDRLIGINQLKALSYNPFSAAANLSFGMISGAIHAAGKTDYTIGEYSRAMKLMLKAKTDKKLADKILNTMDRLGVIGDFVDSRYGKASDLRDNRPKWKRLADPYAMLRSTDFFMKGSTTLAIMFHNTVDINGEKVSIWDTLNEEGRWNEAQYGENKDWSNPEDIRQQPLWDKFRNKVIKVNMIIHGNQDKNSPKLANKYIIGRLLGQFRMSWLPEGWYNRFQSERFDDDLGRAIKGRYRSYSTLGIGGSLSVLGKQFINLIPGVSIDPFKGHLINKTSEEEIDYLENSAVDIENMRRNFAEAAFFLTLSAAIVMLKLLRDDDDEDTAGKAGMQILLNMLIRTKQDIDLYASPGVFNAVFRNPIPAADVVSDYFKAIKATGRVIVDDEYEFQQWLLKMTKAGLPIPQTTQINKWKYMIERDLDEFQ